MVFAAGLGTRLLPLTQHLPKALAPLGGKPLLYYVVHKLWQANIFHIVINVHHFAEQIIAYIDHMPKPAQARFYISNEKAMLRDTGGGLAFAMRQYGEANEDWLIHNVDIWSDFPLHKLINQHSCSTAQITMLVQVRLSSRYLLFNQQNRLCGWFNTKTKERLPSHIHIHDYQQRAFNGIHIANTDIIKHLPNKDSFSLIPAYISLSKHLHIQAVEHNSSLYMDIGKIDTLKAMEQHLQKQNR